MNPVLEKEADVSTRAFIIFFVIITQVPSPAFSYTYDSSRHYFGSDPIEVCIADLTTGGLYPDRVNNYAGMSYEGNGNYSCKCHSNPGNTCVPITTYCSLGMIGSYCHSQNTIPPLPGAGHDAVCGPFSGCMADPFVAQPGRNMGVDDIPIHQQNQCPVSVSVYDNGSNPINGATGNKFQVETDISYGNSFLKFVRYYNSQSISDASANGKKWSSLVTKRIKSIAFKFISGEIVYGGTQSVPVDATIILKNGREYRFTNQFNTSSMQTANAMWNSEAGVTSTLESIQGSGAITGLWYTDENGNRERYGTTGKPIEERLVGGEVLTYSYNSISGLLESIVSSHGNSLVFTFDGNGLLTSVANGEGKPWAFEYAMNGNLVAVIYPDDTPSDSSDNPRKQYLYEDPNFPNALTGIIDEHGNRYATWVYDAAGRATSSQHANNTDTVTFTYNADGTTTVTNPLGKATTYRYQLFNGVFKVVAIEGHPTASCAAANRAYSYDAGGFLISKTDWNGITTSYIRNSRGLEESRVEAVGLPEARTFGTEWHTDYALPVRIVAPGKVTEFTYFPDGTVQTHREYTTP